MFYVGAFKVYLKQQNYHPILLEIIILFLDFWKAKLEKHNSSPHDCPL